jgi:hypothetical protein
MLVPYDLLSSAMVKRLLWQYTPNIWLLTYYKGSQILNHILQKLAEGFFEAFR